jgi:hypothetical protein
MHSKILMVLVVPIFLSACAGAIEPQQFVGPNSRLAYSMRCSGMGRTLDACYKKAGDICPNGYVIVDRIADAVGVPTQSGTMLIQKQSLVIECK